MLLADAGDQLDSLVAPIALYPDPLLAQVLAASTYPLELVQLQQWLAKHKDLKDKALADAVQKERLGSECPGHGGSSGRGQTVGGQHQVDVGVGKRLPGAAVRRDGRRSAHARESQRTAGKLQSNEQMKVETKVVESKSVVVIEQANPQVVYVPSYDPVVVWGAPPVYAYPPVVLSASRDITRLAWRFRSESELPWEPCGAEAGVMAAGWGGNNNININNNNNFNRNNNSRDNIGNSVGSGEQRRRKQLAAQSAAPRRSSLRRSSDGE